MFLNYLSIYYSYILIKDFEKLSYELLICVCQNKPLS